MKYFLSFVLLAATTFAKAQIKLNQKDLHNLIAIAELYSYNTDARGGQFAKSIDSLRTPKLNPIVDALIAVGKGDHTILETRFLARPIDEELILWYVIREIHYNRTNWVFRSNGFFINFGESTINNYTLDIRPSFFSKIIPTLASKL
ncbi:hypothetical protein [Sphingobacterium sp. 18053]|uniref:hypothetical protein n=1 Tax=Sphingobacterium sp. 18053 TaxID=2681401 RepID=UPI00135922C3|nr:hypothetical protein [Sphingobacterium sp. 18053]